MVKSEVPFMDTDMLLSQRTKVHIKKGHQEVRMDHIRKTGQKMNNTLDLTARYASLKPDLDIMTIGPKGANASIGDDDDEQPIIWFFKQAEDLDPLFAEILDWSERTPSTKDNILKRISKVTGWDLTLLKTLVKKAEEDELSS